MPCSASIAILFEEHACPENYGIFALAEYWQEEGMQVHFLFGTSRFVPADLVIIHVDLSIVPPSYLDFASRYPRALNLRASDIRKRRMSPLSVEKDPAYTGPVIVKSNLNYGGLPELTYWRNQLRKGGSSSRMIAAASFGFYRSTTAFSGGTSYPIFPSPSHVPMLFRKCSYWLVEKFRPERYGNLFAIRTCLFLGRRETSFLMISSNPLIKSKTAVQTIPLEPDPRLRAMREKLGFDYGKFDYVLIEGEPVLIDANKTVSTAGRLRDPSLAASRRERARGIHDYLD